jgi:hypothetical protein
MKYRHHGYRDDDYQKDRERKRPEKRGPREITTREATLVMRCWQCGSHQESTDPDQPMASCTNCKADLHCCRNCLQFDPGARFQCRKPIEKAYKDKTVLNHCTVFEPRQVLDATGRRAASPGPKKDKPSSSSNGDDPREAFHNLFNK